MRTMMMFCALALVREKIFLSDFSWIDLLFLLFFLVCTEKKHLHFLKRSK